MDFETITMTLVGGYAGTKLFQWYQGGGVDFDVMGDLKQIAANPVWRGLPFAVAWASVVYTPEMLYPMADMLGGYLLPTVASFATWMGEKMYINTQK